MEHREYPSGVHRVWGAQAHSQQHSAACRMHLATQKLKPTQISWRQAAANYRPAACAPQNADAHATRNSSLLPVVTREIEPQKKAEPPANFACAILLRLVMRRVFAYRS